MREDEFAWPPPESPFLDEDIALERIRALTSTARTTWLVLLGFLAFIGLTLLSVRDVDFFSISATTQLPIVDVAIRTTTFFWAAPLLAAGLHVHFHVSLLKLWDALAAAPPEIGRLRLGDRVFPWLINDWALRRRADRPTTKRPMDPLGSLVTSIAIWLAAPIVLAGFWWRSLPAHNAPLGLIIAAALALSLYTSVRGWRRARSRLARPGIGSVATTAKRAGFVARSNCAIRQIGVGLLWAATLAVAPGLMIATVAGAGGHQLPVPVEDTLEAYWPDDWEPLPLVRANLVDAEISIEPPDWRDFEIARRRFHVEWCDEAGIPAHACETPHYPDQMTARQRWCDEFDIKDCGTRFQQIDDAFEAEWSVEREAYISNIRGPDLRDRDLRNANASGAFVVGVDLRGARLERAYFGGARLERAYLNEARLEGTYLSGARLEEADLGGAWLEGANLTEAQLAGAYLGGAQLRRAHLVRARLEGAYLSGARLAGANLSGARLQGADLHHAELERADLGSSGLQGVNFRYAELEGANLREAVLENADLRNAGLERADLREARLHGADLRNARLEGANLLGADLEGTDLREAVLVGSDLQYAKLEGANLFEAELEGANLGLTRLEGANLSEAELEGADLSYATLAGADLRQAVLEGSNLHNAELQSAEWAGANFGASAAHSTDFTGGRNLMQKQLAQVIGDDATTLPRDAEAGLQLHVWACWDEATADTFVQLQMQHRDRPTADEWWDRIRRNAWVCAEGMEPLPVLGKR